MMMDRKTRETSEESPRSVMFADNIVICSEGRELVRWRHALDRRGTKVTRSKIENTCM